MSKVLNLPNQQLSFSGKTKEWRKKHLLWADNRSFFNDSSVRKSVAHKTINYNLINGHLDMSDMSRVLNPDDIKASFVPETIIHYPIINSKLNVLRGEEAKRKFDAKAIVTNPNAISTIEDNKKKALLLRLLEIMQNNALSEEEFNAELEKSNEYFTYEWLDFREIRANRILSHYVKELSLPIKFNQGFMDAMTVGEEIYQCDIVSGEPTVERLNPLKVRVYKSGYSNKIEDADIIVLEDFWSPGKIIDSYYDVLTPKDITYIEDLPNVGTDDGTDNFDERNNFISYVDNDGVFSLGAILENYSLFAGGLGAVSEYSDGAGNIKVLRVYWKSRRKIKKVKYYDPQTGEEQFGFYPETYILNESKGEEETIYWINEAWEGTKIGKEIYVNMRPRPVQYNRMSNPSKCHFGIIGSLYNFNDNSPYSLVDMMKPYNYLYDAIHDRLNKAIAANWGKILEMDLASIPKGWDIDKWLYYAKVNHIAVKDSFNEGNIGAATGKLAGSVASQSRGHIDAESGNNIQHQVNLLDFIKMEMAEVAGISKLREGQISNRETVGGVERANLLSSYITEWLFLIHDDIKKRVYDCLIETTKIALKGGAKKFQYILSDHSTAIMDVDGDEFAECDYGIVVDNSIGSQVLESKLDGLAQAALQNLTLSFSTVMKIFTNSSLAETQRLIEKDETKMQEMKSQEFLRQLTLDEKLTQMKVEQAGLDRDQKENANVRDNETRLLIALMGANANTETSEDIDFSPEAKANLEEKIREFDEKLSFDRTKHQSDTELKKEDLSIKRILKKSPSNA